MPRPAPPLLLSSQNSVVSLARARYYCLVAERRVSPSGAAASNAHRVGTRSSAATGVHLPSRPMMNSPHTLSRSPGRIFGPGAGSEETFATLAPDTQRSSIGIRWSWTRTSRALGRAPGEVGVSGRRVACAREVRGWGCGVVASRDGLVPGRGRGRERGGREGNSRETHVAGSGVPRAGAAADRGRGGEAGRATWRRRRRGVARVARAHLFRVGGARSGCARGEARRRGRVPLRVRRALTGRGEDVDRSFPFGARVSAVEQRV